MTNPHERNPVNKPDPIIPHVPGYQTPTETVDWHNYLGEIGEKYRGRKVLEIGACAGDDSAVLTRQGTRVTATDINPNLLSVAREYGAAEETVALDMHHLPFSPNSFDALLMPNCIIFGQGRETEIIKGATRAVKPGGEVMICTNLVQGTPGIGHTPKALEQCMYDSGLTDVNMHEAIIPQKAIWAEEGRPYFVLLSGTKPQQ